MDQRTVGSSGAGPLARRPEIVPVAATVLCWAALIADSPAVGWSRTGTSIAGHGAHGGVFTWSGVAMVAVMTMAMMGLLAVPGTQVVAARLSTRVGGPVLWFFAAFVVTWTVVALCLAPVSETLGGVLGSPATAAGILTLLCAAAHFDPRRRDRLRDCDRSSVLHATGSGPVVDCARFGISTASRGFRFCALPMLAMLALPGSLPFMALLTVLVVADRATPGRHWVLISVVYVLLGFGLLGVGLLR